LNVELKSPPEEEARPAAIPSNNVEGNTRKKKSVQMPLSSFLKLKTSSTKPSPDESSSSNKRNAESAEIMLPRKKAKVIDLTSSQCDEEDSRSEVSIDY